MKRVAAWAAVMVLLLGSPAAAFKRTSLGDPLKDFTLPTPSGEAFRLAEHLGEKATVLVFWAMWSPRSAEALGEFQELYREHREHGLQVVGVNVEHQEREPGEAERIAAWLGERGISFPVVVDESLAVFNDYGVIAVPSLVLLDPEGAVRALLEGYSRMTRDTFKEEVLRALGLVEEVPSEAATEPRGPKPKGLAERYARMGEILLKRRMAARAEEAFRKALEEDPDYVRAKEGLARAEALLAEERGEAKPPAAAPGSEAKPAEEPRVPPAPAVRDGTGPVSGAEPNPKAVRYVRMGRMLMDRGLYENARGVFQKAAELDPGYGEAFEGWAQALEKLGRPDEARSVREKAPNPE
ncbi:redoxin domain-containing protein [Deferrisoma sp.]